MHLFGSLVKFVSLVKFGGFTIELISKIGYYFIIELIRWSLAC